MKKVLSLLLTAAFAFTGFCASRMATENWVKEYLTKNYTATGGIISQRTVADIERNPPTSEPVTLTTASGEEITDAQLVFNVYTNIALIATNSSIAEVPNGTLWAWNENAQAYENKTLAFLPKIEQEIKRYTTENAGGIKSVDDYYTYKAEVDGVKYSSYFNEGTYLQQGNDSSKRFKLSPITISDTAANALRFPDLVSRWFSPMLGGWATAISRAISSQSPPPAGGVGGGVSLTGKYRGQQLEVYLGGSPTKVVQCEEQDADGNNCTKPKYDYSLWSDPKEWGISFPLTTFLADGDYIEFSEQMFMSTFKWAKFVNDCIAAAEAAHLPHEFPKEEPHTHEHEHNEGDDCRCDYVCEFKDKKTGEKCTYKCTAHLDYCDRTIIMGRCMQDCDNPNCYYGNNKWIFHSTPEPIMDGTDDNPSLSHTCDCGAFKRGHYRNEPYHTTKDGNRYVHYTCSVPRLMGYVPNGYEYDACTADNGCGYQWEELEDEHEHAYGFDANGNEVCIMSKWNDAGYEVECGEMQAHNYTKVKKGDCKSCTNEMAWGDECGDIKHSEYHKVDGDEANHYCDCGDYYEPHEWQYGEGGEEGYDEEVTDKTGTYIIHCVEKWCKVCGYDASTVEERDDPKPPEEATHSEGECGNDPEHNRGEKCKCKDHPNYQFPHEWVKKTDGCAECKFCATPIGRISLLAEYHGKPWTDCDPQGASEDLIGHQCSCSYFVEGHDFDKKAKKETNAEGRVITKTVCTCKKCNHSYETSTDEECPHGEYLEDGTYRSFWVNCQCSVCHEWRNGSEEQAHAFSTQFPVTASGQECPKYRCSNTNGDGTQCSATGSVASGDHYYGTYEVNYEASIEDIVADKPSASFHRCWCGKKTAAHSVSTTTSAEDPCLEVKKCADSPEGCGHEFGEGKPNHKPTMCGKNTFCSVCGKMKSGDYWLDMSGDSEDLFHSAGGVDMRTAKACKCDCGQFTSHKTRDDGQCGCWCGEVIAPHIAGTPSCFCITHNSLIKHKTPYKLIRHEDRGQIKTCALCGDDIMGIDIEFKCTECDTTMSTDVEWGSHECEGGEISQGVVVYSVPDGTDRAGNPWQIDGHTAEDNGKEFSCAGIPACSGIGGNGGAGSVTFSGIQWTFTGETGLYDFQIQADDSAVVFGVASGPNYYTAGEVVTMRLEKGKTYEISGSCGSVGGPMSLTILKWAVPHGQ